MVLYMVEHGQESDEVIPAVLNEDGNLEFRHNGISAKFFYNVDFGKYNRADFQYFTTEPYLRTKGEFWEVPYYIYTGGNGGPQIWQLFYVSQKRGSEKGRLLYTILKPCPPKTRLCQCKHCSNRFVLNSGEYDFYEGRQLKVPVDSCPTCREKRKLAKG